MERRRFVPRSEGLEARELLSVAGAEPAPPPPPDVPVALEVGPEAQSGEAPTEGRERPDEGVRTIADRRAPDRVPPAPAPGPGEAMARERLPVHPDDPNIAPLRNMRIDRLPGVLRAVRHDRYVPPEVLEALQEDLRLVAGQLHRAPQPALQAFNLQVRSTLAQSSVSVADAAALDRIFGVVLSRAGASDEVVQQFRADMQALAHAAIQEPNPTPLVANDYAVVLQTALAIGTDLQNLQAPERARALPRGGLGTNPALGN